MKASKRFALVAMAAALAALFGLGLAWGRWPDAQEKKAARPSADAANWTAESHDGTNFPLTGRHRTTACVECHIKGVFEGTPTECESCHWDRQQDDRYKLRLGSHCEDCHTPVAWKAVTPGRWNHDAITGFRLAGIHKTLDCAECHGEDFKQANPDCFSCHQEDYREAENPDHVAAGFPTDCVRCHLSQTSWSGARTVHLTFALRGQHAVTPCSACHANGQYAGTPADCVACHLADYNGTTDPNHRAAGFPTDCASCHGDAAATWSGANFNHSSFFALQGAHRTLDCSACHDQGYNLPTDCYGCHAADYSATSDPNHVSAGFPTSCETCHLPAHTSWSQAVFRHDFPINSGKHAGLACTDCHLTSNFRDFSCTDCHTRSATDDRHDDVSGYVYNSANCYACHPRGIADD